MWLPSDERRLLSGLYKLIKAPETQERCENGFLIWLVEGRRSEKQIRQYNESGDSDNDSTGTIDIGKFKRQLQSHIALGYRKERALKALTSRNMIRVLPHQHDNTVIFPELTLEGFDLGRKYATFLGRSGLWFREYRHHWLFMLFGYIMGYGTHFIFKLLGT